MDNLKQRLGGVVAALALAVGIAAGGHAVAVTTPTPVAALPGDSVLVAGGTIRFTEDGPRWHINTAHRTVGFDTSVEPTIDSSGRLHANILDPHPVITTDAAADESLTANGIRAGISGGVQDVSIQFWKAGVNGADGAKLNLNNEVHYDRISCDLCNVWFTVLQDGTVELGN